MKPDAENGGLNPDYSILIPVYYNEGSLRRVFQQLEELVFRALAPLRGEVVFIDDGSGDGSWQVIRELHAEFPGKVRAVRLSRNFGQLGAVWCGLGQAKGRAVCLMAADGQEPAEALAAMLRAHFEGGHEVVIGTRAEREESLYRRWTSHVFYTLMRLTAFPTMPEGGFDFLVLGRRAVDALLQTLESPSFFQGKVLQLGYSPHFMPYTRRARLHGKSRWSFRRKVSYLLDAVVGHSFVAIRALSMCGVLLACVGFGYAALIFFWHLVYGNPVKGWAPLMIVVLIIGGFQMLMLGMIGEYIWRVMALVRKQAPYLIDTVLAPAPRAAEGGGPGA